MLSEILDARKINWMLNKIFDYNKINWMVNNFIRWKIIIFDAKKIIIQKNNYITIIFDNASI